MKSVMVILLILFLYSCGKDKAKEDSVIPAYVGTYTNVGGDTVYVSTTERDSMILIRWCAMGNAAKINFDSVIVFPNLSFTDNQLVEYFGLKTAIGSGYFGDNTANFNFVVDGNGHIDFNGIKKSP